MRFTIKTTHLSVLSVMLVMMDDLTIFMVGSSVNDMV